MTSLPEAPRLGGDLWLAGFYEGSPEAMEACYRTHFATVDAAVASVLRGADRETVVQDVFARLMSDSELRLAFKGGQLTPWLRVVSRNLAIDFLRRRKFELPDGLMPRGEPAQTQKGVERQVEAHMLVDRFRKDHLPPEWAAVFEARFIRQMDQRSAARHVGISRTTLAYRECRIRLLLRRFILREGSP
jgi:RNA polymerase sigma-70 factor (ECF subfamily)